MYVASSFSDERGKDFLLLLDFWLYKMHMKFFVYSHWSMILLITPKICIFADTKYVL